MALNESLDARSTIPDLADAARAVPGVPGRGPWMPGEFQAIADVLLAELDRLTDELASADQDLSELLRNSGDSAGDDQAGNGSSALEREHELILVNITRDMLQRTTRALERISAGTFARCDSCHEAIGKARMQGFPARHAVRGLQAARGAALSGGAAA